MRNQSLREEYFNWAYSLIGKQSRTYFKLCRLLDSIPYRWSVPNDENRGDDGYRLRDIFAQEMGLDNQHVEVVYFFRGPCSVFEMLVALTRRIDDQLVILEDQDSRCAKWFLELLMNLKLAQFTDNRSPSKRFLEMDEQHIYKTIEVLLDRMYDYNGDGGLFPLKKAKRDQRRVEIWYQMQAYLEENYA